MKMRFQFEADEYGNILWGEADDGFRITTSVRVPTGASDDYGYITMKKAVLFEIAAREMDADEIEFPYDGQEHYLAEDADAVTDVYIDVRD